MRQRAFSHDSIHPPGVESLSSLQLLGLIDPIARTLVLSILSCQMLVFGKAERPRGKLVITRYWAKSGCSGFEVSRLVLTVDGPSCAHHSMQLSSQSESHSTQVQAWGTYHHLTLGNRKRGRSCRRIVVSCAQRSSSRQLLLTRLFMPECGGQSPAHHIGRPGVSASSQRAAISCPRVSPTGVSRRSLR